MLLRGLLRRETGARGEPGELLSGLLRVSGQDTATAGVILTVVLATVAVRLLTGPAVNPLGLPVLLATAGTFLIAAGYAVRTRVVVRRMLEHLRERVGAPLHPGVPWVPLGTDAVLDGRELHRELRHLVSVACRCHDLALNALVWALVTLLLTVVWLLA